MKKFYRVITKFSLFYFIKFIQFLFYRTNYKILPALSDYKNLLYDFSNETRRLVLRKPKKTFDKLYIDSSLAETELCLLGKKYETNKSSINIKGHRSGYTGLYSLLFNSLKNKSCSIAEIGIEKNGSTKMWRTYFNQAYIHCFEKDYKKINLAKKQKLNKVKYSYIDVSDEKLIQKSFSKTKKKFDIIIDDSTHEFEHQINIVKNVNKFIKKNGILIIEDIYRFRKGYSESRYYNELKKIKHLFSKITFIETLNINNFTSNWKCEKILLFIKK